MSTNGIYGLSGSGLDIESLVKVGMMKKQSQYNKMQQTQTINEWTKSEWATVYSKYNDYEKALSTFKMQSNMSAMKAVSGNSNVVSATANGAAAAMTHQVSVSQMATNAYIMTDGDEHIDRANKAESAQSSTSLKDVIFSNYSAATKVGEKNTYTVDGKTVNGSDVAISVTFTDGSNTGTVSYTYDDLLEDNKTLSDFASAISGSGVALQGGYDTVNDSFSIYAKNSGSKNMIGISTNNENSAKLMNSLHLAEYDGNTDTLNKLSDFSADASTLTSKALTSDNVLKNLIGDDFSMVSLSNAEVDAYNQKLQDDATANGTTVNEEDKLTYGDYYKLYNASDASVTPQYIKKTDNAISFNVDDGKTSTTVSYSYKDLVENNITMSNVADSINAGMKTTKKKDDGTTETIQNLTAAWDSTSMKMTLTNSEGAVSIKTMTKNAEDLLNNMGFSDASGTKTFENGKTTSTYAASVVGTDAKVRVDGKDYVLDSNSKTIAGVTYTFTGISEKNAAGNPITSGVTVTQDTDTIVKNVKDFVESYNALLDYMNDKLAEQRYKDYKPLTSMQEEQMTETQVNKWTEKAKSGLLYHDSTLQNMVSKMREAIYTPVDAVDSAYNSAAAIGISTTNVKGHLTLNEDKLKEALAADPDCVYQIFASDQDSAYIAGSTNKNKITNSQKMLDYKNTGLANRLYNLMGDFKDNIKEYAGTSAESDDQSYLGKLITNMQTKMSTFKTQMNAFETQLFKKYDAMELALQKLAVQLNYVSSANG